MRRDRDQLTKSKPLAFNCKLARAYQKTKGLALLMMTKKPRPISKFCSHIASIVYLLLLITHHATGQESQGEALFLANCAECHQADGQGIPNVYPALAGNSLVNASAVDVALVLLIGRGEMPSFAGMVPSSEIAAIINYVRNAWGNQGSAITAELIESL